MVATALDLSQIKTDALSSAATFRSLIELGSTDTPTFKGSTLTGGTVTTSTPVIDATQTWNDAAVTFTGMKLDVTDTASASDSLLMDLQVGGTSKFNIDKKGRIVFNPDGIQFRIGQYNSDNIGFYSGVASQNQLFLIDHAGVGLTSNNWFGWSATTTLSNDPDTKLYRDAANTLAQRNGTNANEYRVYNTFTNASNYERLSLQYDTSNNAFVIGPASAGTGQDRLLYLAGNSSNLLNKAFVQIGSNIELRIPGGSRLALATNSINLRSGMVYNEDRGNLGRSDLRWGEIFLGGETVTTSTPVLDATQTWNDAAVTFTGMKLDVTDTASASGSLLLDLQVGGTSKFKVDKDGSAIGYNASTWRIAEESNAVTIGNVSSTFMRVSSSTVQLLTGSATIWKPGNEVRFVTGGTNPMILQSAGNLYEFRNDQNSLTCNIYNTYTDASNYERAFLKWDANVFKIGTEAAGTGTVRTLTIENVAKINGSTSSAADPSTTEYPNDGDHGIHKNTTSGNVFLAYNDGGSSIVKVQLS